jgi:hypothetical protein
VLLALVCTALAAWALAAPGDAASETLDAAALPAAQPHASDVEMAAPARGSIDVPVRLPETAENIGFDGAAGTLAFDSSASMATLAEFYRTGLKHDGWLEKRAPITRPNMVALSFARDGKTLSFTILQMASHATVDADGSGLVSQAAEPEVTGSLDATP